MNTEISPQWSIVDMKLVFPNKNVDPSIVTHTHTRFCPLSTVAFVNNMYSVPAEPEWMTVSSVQPRSTNHAARLGGKQSLRPKMKEEKGAPLKNKIIYQIFLLVCFGFCNSGMLPVLLYGCFKLILQMSKNLPSTSLYILNVLDY